MLFLVVLPVAAAEGWEAACAKEGGCIAITRDAYNTLLDHIAMLKRVIEAMKKEQCA